METKSQLRSHVVARYDVDEFWVMIVRDQFIIDDEGRPIVDSVLQWHLRGDTWHPYKGFDILPEPTFRIPGYIAAQVGWLDAALQEQIEIRRELIAEGKKTLSALIEGV